MDIMLHGDEEEKSRGPLLNISHTACRQGWVSTFVKCFEGLLAFYDLEDLLNEHGQIWLAFAVQSREFLMVAQVKQLHAIVN